MWPCRKSGLEGPSTGRGGGGALRNAGTLVLCLIALGASVWLLVEGLLHIDTDAALKPYRVPEDGGRSNLAYGIISAVGFLLTLVIAALWVQFERSRDERQLRRALQHQSTRKLRREPPDQEEPRTR